MAWRWAALLTLVATLLLPMGAAFADETPSPSSTASPGAEPSEGAPVDPNQTAITVTLTDAAKENAPVVGVTLTALDDAKNEVGSAASDAEGKAVIPVPAKGNYTVTIDEDTLPEGIELSDKTPRSVTVAVRLDGPFNFAAFPIGVQAVNEVAFGTKLISSLLSGIKFGLIVGLAALGLSLIFGATGLTNFSHGELITLGGLATYFFNRDVGLPVVVAGLLAMVLGAGAGYAQDKLLWGPLRRRGTGLIAMMIVSIGFGLFLRSLYQYYFSSSTRSLSQYTTQERRTYLGFIKLADKEVAIILIAVVVIAIVSLAMVRTRLGKAMRAVSDNPALSASSGMRVDGVISSAWIIGTALSALSGVLLSINSQVNVQMGFKALLLVFAAVTLGGLGTIWGSLFGSMVIGILVEVGPLFGVPSSIKEVGALVVLIVILLVRPQGILGRAQRVG